LFGLLPESEGGKSQVVEPGFGLAEPFSFHR
jgi:hypothetical protein